MSWGTCPACDGTGTHVDCSECVDTGVNVYDADFDPAHPQPCQHCQPVTDADVIYAGIRRYCTDSPHYTGELA